MLLGHNLELPVTVVAIKHSKFVYSSSRSECFSCGGSNGAMGCSSIKPTHETSKLIFLGFSLQEDQFFFFNDASLGIWTDGQTEGCTNVWRLYRPVWIRYIHIWKHTKQTKNTIKTNYVPLGEAQPYQKWWFCCYMHDFESSHIYFHTIFSTDRPSDRRLLAKLVPTFADRGCGVVSATDSHDR
jgi:hypothetical protein